MQPNARLIILPAAPGGGGGYQIAVRADLRRLEANAGDLIICRSQSPPPDAPHMLAMRMRRMSLFGLRRMAGTLMLRPPGEIYPGEIRRLLRGKSSDFQEIFCGEVHFYRALRKLFPHAHLKVRFHNFYSFARYRQSLRRFPISWELAHYLHTLPKLEAEVLSDKNVTPIFITQEELSFAKLAFPQLRGEYWPVVEPITHSPGPEQPPTTPRLVYFGSAPPHSAAGIHLLCKQVLPRLADAVGDVQLHLFGRRTERFRNRGDRVHAHGRYEGPGLPLGGDGLFVVPDLHGCGIKIKVAELIREKVPFISTPFGMSGYDTPHNPHILVGDIEEWPEIISAYFEKYLSPASVR